MVNQISLQASQLMLTCSFEVVAMIHCAIRLWQDFAKVNNVGVEERVKGVNVVVFASGHVFFVFEISYRNG